MSITVSFANKSDKLALKRLFLNCFDDTLGFVNMLFEHHFIPENTVVAKDGDQIVGEALMLPCRAEGRDCYYIYGVCTHPEMRGQGIGSKIVSFARDAAISSGGACLLHPENESLFGFYEKLGFSPCAYVREISVTPTAEPVALLPVSPQEYTAYRNELFADKNPVLWDEDAVEYALKQETFFGGKYFKFETEIGVQTVLCGKDGSEIYIKETTAKEEALDALCTAVLKAFGGESVTVLLPGKVTDKVTALGVGFKEPVYINLMLD